jgi:malate dehydrogenase (quinone)
MEYSEDFDTIKSWIPLVMQGRDKDQKVAATINRIGTDVNFGNLTRSMFDYLKSQDGVELHFNHEVKKLKNKEGKWVIKVQDLSTNYKRKITTDFVFIGAGGGSLPLLEKSGIPEIEGYGGFPVSGQWLRCTNREVIEQHQAKVYGKAAVGAPPMSVPHIDSRVINGKKELLFGPYAGFSTKFLKNGSYFDLFKSINLYNIVTMVSAGLSNIPLTKYLIDQVKQSKSDKINYLREFIPNADPNDWVLETAGQRVQVIKKDAKGKGILEFGTEVIKSSDGSLAVLLGASPGASTAVSIMIDLIEKCFSEDFSNQFSNIIPSYGKKLNNDKKLCQEIRNKTNNLF